MTRTLSPLRYPGGKSVLLDVVGEFLRLNHLEGGHYVEPFAGGGGLALALLFQGHVSEIHLNDIDPSIAALWLSLLDNTDDLVGMLMQTPITIDEWHRQREIYLRSDQSDKLELGFSALFLNRTNRSGIIKGAGVIGGLRQNGNYLLDCRFNKIDLSQRIRRIKKYRDRIHFSCEDALPFLARTDDALPKRALFCIDPPYYHRGAELYTSFYKPHDHKVLASQVLNLKHHWLTTYDDCPEISDLYRSRRQYRVGIQYSVRTKRIGSELLILSKRLRAPAMLKSPQEANLLATP